MFARLGSLLGGGDSGPEDEPQTLVQAQVTIPFTLSIEHLVPWAESSISADRKAEILASLDEVCKYRGDATLKIEDMDKIIWSRYVVLDTEGKHPFLMQTQKTLSFEVMINKDDVDGIISRTLKELLPSVKANRTVWIMEIEISKMRCDYPHSIELRIEDPESDWRVWWSENEQNMKGEMEEFDTISKEKTMLNRSLTGKFQIARNRLWAIYVVKSDVKSMVKKRSGGHVLLERNLETVIILETLLASDGVPHEMLEELRRCSMQTDMKYFKMNEKTFDDMMEMIESTLKPTRMMDKKIQMRRFDAEHWTNSVITVRFELDISIFYRVFPEDKGVV